MAKEFRIPHERIGNSQTVSKENAKIFKEQGLDVHTDEVTKLEDDPDKKQRVITVRPRKYFFLGGK